MAPRYDTLAVTVLRMTADTPVQRDYYVMRFPGRWKEALRRQAQARLGRDRVSIPVASLNAAITALVPDCVITMPFVGRGNDDEDWLLAYRQINPAALFALVGAWVRAQRGTAEQTAQTLAQLHASDLVWSPVRIEFDDAGHRARVMRLLPMEIAATLSRPELACPHGDLQFRRCPSADGAEVMSWPPRGTGDQTPYSVKIGITAQTLPTSEELFVYLCFGVRRWMPERGNLGNYGHSVYLAPTVPYLCGLENSRHFGVAKIKEVRVGDGDGAATYTPRWRDDLAGVLAEAGCLARLPDPQQLTDKPLDYLEREDDAAALVYSTGMLNFEKVSAGMSVTDRASVVGWAAETLAPELHLSDPLPRRRTTVYKGLGGLVDGVIAPERISAVVGPRLDVELLTDTGLATTHALQRLSARLGVPLPGSDELGDRPILVELGPLTVSLRRPTAAAVRGDLDRSAHPTRTVRAAVEDRVSLIEEQFDRAAYPTVVLVEVAHPDRYQGARRGDDPKFAIRHGLLRTGRLSQFVNPVVDSRRPPRVRAGREPSDANRERFAAAVDDMFRQLGVRPELLPEPVPGTLNRRPALLALWMVRQNKGQTWGVRRQVPIALLVDPTGQEVQIRAPQVEWQPLHTGLLEIGRRYAEVNLVCGSEEVQRFVKDVLQEAVAAYPDTLLLTHAQNMRTAWSTLANSRLRCDALGFGAADPIPMETFPGLRHVRVRTVEGGETPECFGVTEHDTGQPQGLWQFLQPRVFGSTSGKPVTHTNARKGDSKLVATEYRDRLVAPKLKAQVWNPQFVEVFVAGLQTGDQPEHWAALTHELRDAAPYVRDTTILPWPLHLAAQVEEYLLPKSIAVVQSEEAVGDVVV